MEPTAPLEKETLESEEAAEPPLLTFFSSSRSRAFLKEFYPFCLLFDLAQYQPLPSLKCIL